MKKEKLIGWLIAFDDNVLGESYELRLGRYLISGVSGGLEEAKENNIYVKREDVLSPHIAINVLQDKVQIMDIFTQSGSYITRNGEDTEKRILGVVSLKHGDKIKVGENKVFQVCLING